MSFNGSGSFLINTAGQPVVSGTVISSTAFNALTADLATGLSTCITKDGQTTVTANIPMANYKFTGLGAGSGAADSANLSQVQSTVVKLLASVSGTDTITAVGSPTVAAYAAGQMFYFVAAGDNTGAVTLNIDSLGAKAVTRDGSVALAAGDIKSGEVVVVVYDGTRFQVVSQLNSSGDARFANVSIASALNVGGVATFSAGTAAAPAITTTGDTNTGIFFPAADTIAFAEGGVEAMRIDSSANVGIGTTSPSTRLHVKGDWVANEGILQIDANSGQQFSGLTVQNNGTVKSFLYHDNTNSFSELQCADELRLNVTGSQAIRFQTSGTERMRLDSSGNLGLGVTPSAWGSGLRAIQIGRDGFISAGTTFSEAYVGANTYYDGSNWKYATTNVAAFYSVGETAHKWYTAASGTAGNNITFGDPKMTLDASGNLGIGTASPSPWKLLVQSDANASAAKFRNNAGVSGTANIDVEISSTRDARLYVLGSTSRFSLLALGNTSVTSECQLSYNNSTNVLAITVDSNLAAEFFSSGYQFNNGNMLIDYTASNGAYKLQVNSQIFATSATIATSDGRYKDNIVPLSGSLADVCALNPVQFSWKKHPIHDFDLETPAVGFIAQEVQQVLAGRPYLNSIIKKNVCVLEPEEYEFIILEPAIEEVKDDKGNVIVEGKREVKEKKITKEAVTEEFFGIAESNLVALLTKAIQELKAELDATKAEVAALKGA